MFSTQNEPHAEKICYNTIMLDLERLADEYRILSYLFSTAAILRDHLAVLHSMEAQSSPDNPELLIAPFQPSPSLFQTLRLCGSA